MNEHRSTSSPGPSALLGTAVAAKLAAPARDSSWSTPPQPPEPLASDRCRAAARRRRSHRCKPGRQRGAACGRPAGAGSTASSTSPAASVGNRLPKASAQTWDLLFAMNLKTALHICRSALPWLKARGGRIVNVGRGGRGSGGRRHGRLRGVQVGGPAADRGAGRGDQGPRHQRQRDAAEHHRHAGQPARTCREADYSRWVAPDALADVVAFLLCDGARAITGAGIPVTGRSDDQRRHAMAKWLQIDRDASASTWPSGWRASP